MDGVSAASSITAVIEIGAKVAGTVYKYTRGVISAKEEVKRLCEELENLNKVAASLRELLGRPKGQKLRASQELAEDGRKCNEYLKELLEKVGGGRRMHRFGIGTLAWPLKKPDTIEAAVCIQRWADTFDRALQVDQTNLLLDIEQSLSQLDLRETDGAAFDINDLEPSDNYDDCFCLDNTRTDILANIDQWAADATSERVFWLCGMAGTGKSTISRSVCRSLATKGSLGATFFFDKSVGRDSAKEFVTTLAAQFRRRFGRISEFDQTLKDNVALKQKSIGAQWDKLIVEPLSKVDLNPVPTVVIVVDALDECAEPEKVKAIIQLLVRCGAISTVNLRAFITSRPTRLIDEKFSSLSTDDHKAFLLHEVPPSDVKKDIIVYLTAKFNFMKKRHNLGDNWPRENDFKSIITMVDSLFIYAATLCRYIDEPSGAFSPEEQIKKVVRIGYHLAEGMTELYKPILDQILKAISKDDLQEYLKDFKTIVGSIVLLADPLPVAGIAKLLGIDERTIVSRLTPLHSVILVPKLSHRPVQLYHLTFREFVLKKGDRFSGDFWCDGTAIHLALASRCLSLLRESGRLKRNICDLEDWVVSREDISNSLIEARLPLEVRYACKYWVHHLIAGFDKDPITIWDDVDAFLQSHFLFWLEAMSLLKETDNVIHLLSHLESHLEKMIPGHSVVSVVHDLIRFTLKFRSLIEKMPLQIYRSALAFSPEQSIVKKRFTKYLPEHLQRIFGLEAEWSPEKYTIESRKISCLAFSPDGRYLALSDNSSTSIWDPATGACLISLEPPSSFLAFSAESEDLISGGYSYDDGEEEEGDYDEMIRIWNIESKTLTRSFKLTSSLEGIGVTEAFVYVMALSNKNTLVTAAGDRGKQNYLYWWDITGKLLEKDPSPLNIIKSMQFSPDGTSLLVSDFDLNSQVWHVGTKECVLEIPDSGLTAFLSSDKLVHIPQDNSDQLLFMNMEGKVIRTVDLKPSHLGGWNSPNCSLNVTDNKLAVRYSDTGILVWTISGDLLQVVHDDQETSKFVFSPNGKHLACVLENGMRMLDATGAKTLPSKRDLGNRVLSSRVSSNQKSPVLVTAYDQGDIALWDLTMQHPIRKVAISSPGFWEDAWTIIPIDVSTDGPYLATGCYDNLVRIYDVRSVEQVAELSGDGYGRVTSVKFSPDCKYLAAAWEGGLTYLLAVTSKPNTSRLEDFEKGYDGARAVSFSGDSRYVFTLHYDGYARIWVPASAECIGRIDTGVINSSQSLLAVSPKGDRPAVIYSAKLFSRKFSVKVWNIKVGKSIHPIHEELLCSYSDGLKISSHFHFSSDGRYLISGANILKVEEQGDSGAQMPCVLLYCEDDGWITRGDGMRLLRLPAEYQIGYWGAGYGYGFFSDHNLAAILCESGQILAITFPCSCEDSRA